MALPNETKLGVDLTSHQMLRLTRLNRNTQTAQRLINADKDPTSHLKTIAKIRFELVDTGLSMEKINILNGTPASEREKMKIEQSRVSGILFVADNYIHKGPNNPSEAKPSK